MLRGASTKITSRRWVCFFWHRISFLDLDYVPYLRRQLHGKDHLRARTTITFSIWDLGGQREFVNMLPLVCNDAVAILFMFDLSRKSTLNSVKEWYRQARGFNKVIFWLRFFLLLNPHHLVLGFKLISSTF